MANTLKFGNGEWYGKKDTILAYNSENNNYKPLPFNFSRGSSATVVNKDGLIEEVGSGQPRVDYLNNTKGALLLEPSRTNLITQSESFSNSYWAKARLTATSNSVISPDGTLNASKIFGDGSNSWKYINRNGFSLINQNYYTFSVFAKADTLNYVQLILSGATAENYQNFDLLNGVIGSGSNVFDAKIETFVNGWYKCSMTVLATSTATTDLFIDLADSSTMSRAGSFLTSGGIYIYGAQLEQGSYATSYIPTSGSAVTRLAESDVSLSNLPIFDYTVEDFSISFKITTKSFDSVFSRVLSKASTSSGYEVFIENNGAIYFRTVSSVASVFSYTNPNQIVLGVESNITITRSGAVGKIYKDGIEITSVYANHSNISSSLSNNLRLGSYVQSGYNFSGQIKDVKLYNTVLTDQE